MLNLLSDFDSMSVYICDGVLNDLSAISYYAWHLRLQHLLMSFGKHVDKSNRYHMYI
jgi:hypothetical protein